MHSAFGVLQITPRRGIDAKGNVKVDCNASIYGQILFIFIREKAYLLLTEFEVHTV